MPKRGKAHARYGALLPFSPVHASLDVPAARGREAGDRSRERDARAAAPLTRLALVDGGKAAGGGFASLGLSASARSLLALSRSRLFLFLPSPAMARCEACGRLNRSALRSRMQLLAPRERDVIPRERERERERCDRRRRRRRLHLSPPLPPPRLPLFVALSLLVAARRIVAWIP